MARLGNGGLGRLSLSCKCSLINKTPKVKPFLTRHHTLKIVTRGKGTVEITGMVRGILESTGLTEGVLTVFVRHTSCSLVIMENADPSARRDLHEFFDRLVPDNTTWFQHTQEGPDDMPGHIRAVLTRTSESIPFSDGRMLLGTWQGIFLFEHRKASHRREIIVTVMGE